MSLGLIFLTVQVKTQVIRFFMPNLKPIFFSTEVISPLNACAGEVSDLLDLGAVLADDGAALRPRHGQPDEELLLPAQALQEVPQFPADEAERLEDHIEGAGDGQDLLVPALRVGEHQVGAGLLGKVGFSDILLLR